MKNLNRVKKKVLVSIMGLTRVSVFCLLKATTPNLLSWNLYLALLLNVRNIFLTLRSQAFTPNSYSRKYFVDCLYG